MLRYRNRISAFILTGVISVVAVWDSPVLGQEAKRKEVQATSSVESKNKITTEDPNIPLDELQLLVKPLTFEELQMEAVAWLKLLKNKVKEISNSEIAIKRQNRAIDKQEEAVKALEEAKVGFAEAEKAKLDATSGSPENEKAAKKVEVAKENLKKAQEAIDEAATTQETLKEDERLSSALEKAEETGEIEKAKEVLKEAKNGRDELTAGSPGYDEATKKIDALDAAIAAVEKAQEAQKGAPPDSPEYKKATEELSVAQETLKKAWEAIDPSVTETKQSEESSQNIDRAAAVLENKEVNIDNQTEVTSSPTVNGGENLETKGLQLEVAAKQLQKNADAESELKNQLVIAVTELQSQRTALIDRFEVILEELDRKGGDSKPYRQYIEAISGVEIDLNDTEGLGVRLVSWVKSEEGGLRWAGNMGKFVGIVAASALLSQLIGFTLNLGLSKVGKTSNLLRQFLVMLVKRGGIVVGVLLALTALEVSLGPILALLGGVSFVLAFALQSNIGNLASGLMLMVYKPFDIGDEIKVAGIWGWIDSITLANTKIKGFKGQMITLPNNSVWGAQITNLTVSDIRKGTIYIHIPLSTPIPKAQEILVDLGKSHPLTLDNPAPSTFVWQFGEYYVEISFSFAAKTPDFWTVWSDIHVMIQERFKKEGISFALPVQIKYDGNSTTPQLMDAELFSSPKNVTAPKNVTDSASVSH